MATNFPASLDSLSNPSPNNTLDSPSHSTHHANLNDAIEALEAKVGVDSSAVATSHDKILTLKANIASPTFTGTVTAPTFSGSGASLTSIPNSATTATSGNTASAIVARDASGDFSARVIVATTDAGAGRGVGIAAHTGGTPTAILQFLNNAGNAQWSSLSATNNLLTVSTPIASSSFVGNVTGNASGTAGNVTTAGTTWTPAVVSGTWTNITWTGRYIQVGKMVQFIIFGSATGACVLGTGFNIPLLGLPVAPASTNAGAGFGTIISDNDTLVEYHGITQIGASSTIRPMVTNTSSTYGYGSQLATTVPMTWASGDYIVIQGTYEAA